MKKILFIASLIWIFCLAHDPVHAQLQVSSSLTNTELAQSLVGKGVLISNVSVSCAPDAYGSFDGSASNLGLDQGLLLTTGSLVNAVGPNTTGEVSLENFQAGDPQLDLIANAPTFDACVFQFDVTPYGDTLRFNFSFASEEYLEYVNSFNDVFGFFITGPNPSGGNYVNKNIALIPGTTTPVSVDNINNVVNSQYYFDNGDGNCFLSPSFSCVDPSAVQYDGFTRNLAAVTPVIPCQTYHLKLALADAGDGYFDSGVFIERIESNVNFHTSVTTQNGLPYSIEGCNNSAITITREVVDSNPLVINYTVGGSATDGVDFQSLGTQVTIPANQASAQINLTPIADGLAEPVEKVIIYFSGTCTNVPIDTVVIELTDSLIIETSPDTDICGNRNIMLNASGGSTYSWWPYSTLNSPVIPNPIASVAATTTYGVTVTDGMNCISTGSVTISVLPPDSTFESRTSCNSAEVGVEVMTLTSQNGCDSIHTITTTYLASDSTIETRASCNPADVGVEVVILVNQHGCDSVHVITTTLLPTFEVAVHSPEDIIKKGESITLTAVSNSGDYTYSWITSTGANPNCYDCGGSLTASPATTTSYTLIAVDENGCSDTSSRTIVVEPGFACVYVPNAFTPNGDGLNDVFTVNGEYLQDVQLRIFNRWGEMIFESSNPSGGWDGTYKGQPLPADVFLYSVKAGSCNDSELSQNDSHRTGSVTLIR